MATNYNPWAAQNYAADTKAAMTPFDQIMNAGKIEGNGMDQVNAAYQQLLGRAPNANELGLAEQIMAQPQQVGEMRNIDTVRRGALANPDYSTYQYGDPQSISQAFARQGVQGINAMPGVMSDYTNPDFANPNLADDIVYGADEGVNNGDKNNSDAEWLMPMEPELTQRYTGGGLRPEDRRTNALIAQINQISGAKRPEIRDTHPLYQHIEESKFDGLEENMPLPGSVEAHPWMPIPGMFQYGTDPEKLQTQFIPMDKVYRPGITGRKDKTSGNTGSGA